MPFHKLVAGTLVTLAALAQPAWADTWPSRPIRLIVPFAPGGATDAVARLLAEQLPQRLGQTVVVENKPGAATIIGVDLVAKAPPDGYTILLAGVGSFGVLPALRKDLPFNIEKDLTPIALVTYSPTVLVTASTKPYKTLADLVKAAKARPGDIRYATYGTGSANHLAGEMLARAVGADFEAIPYKGAADAKVALLRGDVDLSFETLGSVGGELKSGRLRALALGGAQRSSLLPDLPSLSEFGYGQAATQPFYGLAVPAATPAAIQARLTKEVLEIMATQETKDKALSVYLEAVAIGPAEMAAIIKRDHATFKQIVQQLKLDTN